LGGQVTDFTSVGSVISAQLSIVIPSLPWIAIWILYACKRCPVIVLSSGTFFTGIVWIVDTETSCILNLPWLALGIIFAISPSPIVELGGIANFTGIGVVSIAHASIKNLPWVTFWNGDASLSVPVPVLLFKITTITGICGVFKTLSS
jgi:hypothetical protein